MSQIDTDRLPHDQPPVRFSAWDVLGFSAYTLGTMLNELDNGLRLMSRVFFAAGEYSRQRRMDLEYAAEQEEARREMAASLEGLLAPDVSE